MSTIFERPMARRTYKMDVPQMVVPNGASGATLTQTKDVKISGIVRAITVGINNNTGNKTAIVSLIDADGSILFTGASVAENTDAAPVVQQFMTVSSTDLPLEIICDGTITVSALMNGDPGTSTGLIDISLYIE